MIHTQRKVDLFLFMGQSNMAGRGIVNQTWTEAAPAVLPGAGYEFRAVTDPTRLYEMSEPFGVNENREDGINDGKMKTGSLVTAFTNAYYTHNGNIPVVGISASKGGSRIAQWQPGGAFFNDVLSRLCACVSYLESHNYRIRHKFVLWCQGESDGDHGTPKEEYISCLEKMWYELKQHGMEKIFIIGIGNCNIEGAYDRYKKVQARQKEFAKSQPDAVLVSTAFESMRERGLMKDAFHYYQQGYNECGRDAGINTASYVNRQKLHLSVDDFFMTLKELTERESQYDSIFTHPIFSFFRDMHEKYGAVFHCYCFGEDTEGFSLAEVTRKYREEFQQNADWLKFGFHGKNTDAVYGDNNGTRVINRDVKQAAEDYDFIMGNLAEIVGEEALDLNPRVHYFAGTKECCRAWKTAKYGIEGLLAADDERFSYYHNQEKHDRLIADNVLYDADLGLTFRRTNIRLENETDMEQLKRKIKTFTGEFPVVFTHERYLPLEDMQRKIEACLQESMVIQHIAFQDAIVLYWEKPENLSHGQYQIFVNEKEVGITDKTHYTLKNLTPETAYRIQVKDKLQGVNIGDMLIFTAKAKKRLDVTKAPYHAVGDGQTMNTKALQQAFDDCKADEMVYLPAGVYLTGALRMHSDMELYLEEGAVLQGTDVVEDYLPRIKSRFEGIENESYSSLLNLGELDHDGDYNCRNVVIRGKGTIASGGRVLAERVIASERERLADYLAQLGDKIKECEKPETIPGRVRPRLINMSNCQNIVLSGVQFKNGASWNVHMIYSDSIVTNDCTFYSENVWNGDGWDPDSSTNCTIFGCTFYTGDDSVAIKSGKNPEGNQINRPAKHIRIFDCKCAFGHGIALGSEMSGGIEDVRIWDCDMSNSLCGIEIKGTKKRGGYVRNVQVRDCATARVMFHAVGYNDDGIGAPVPPVFENCSFERMRITGEYFDNHTGERAACDAIELVGFDEPGYELKDILFRDVTIGKEGHTGKQTLTLQLCENITFERLRCL